MAGGTEVSEPRTLLAAVSGDFQPPDDAQETGAFIEQATDEVVSLGVESSPDEQSNLDVSPDQGLPPNRTPHGGGLLNQNQSGVADPSSGKTGNTADVWQGGGDFSLSDNPDSDDSDLSDPFADSDFLDNLLNSDLLTGDVPPDDGAFAADEGGFSTFRPLNNKSLGDESGGADYSAAGGVRTLPGKTTSLAGTAGEFVSSEFAGSAEDAANGAEQPGFGVNNSDSEGPEFLLISSEHLFAADTATTANRGPDPSFRSGLRLAHNQDIATARWIWKSGGAGRIADAVGSFGLTTVIDSVWRESKTNGTVTDGSHAAEQPLFTTSLRTEQFSDQKNRELLARQGTAGELLTNGHRRTRIVHPDRRASEQAADDPGVTDPEEQPDSPRLSALERLRFDQAPRGPPDRPPSDRLGSFLEIQLQLHRLRYSIAPRGPSLISSPQDCVQEVSFAGPGFSQM